MPTSRNIEKDRSVARALALVVVVATKTYLACSVIASVVAGTAHAQEEKSSAVSGAVEVYTDTDETTVLTVITNGRWQASESVSVEPALTLDAVSSASVDVISAATPKFTTLRVEPKLGATLTKENYEFTAAAVMSAEADWLSFSGQLVATRFLAQKNASLSGAFGFTHNRISDARDAIDFADTMNAMTWEVGFSQLLSRNTRVVLTHTGQLSLGFNASPYRTVSFGNGQTEAEIHPDARWRFAGVVSLHHHLANDLGLWASYRFYGDNWAVYSHTVALRLMKDLSQHWSLQLRGRGYWQGDADFYRSSYDNPANFDFFTFDKELSQMWSAGGGGAAFWRPNERWSSSLRLEAYRFGYQNFPALRRRVAVISTLSIAAAL